MMQAYGELTGEMAQEKKAREEAEGKIASLETEKNNADAKWHQELEMKQSMIANLDAHKSKQSATIAKLKEEKAELRATALSSRAEVAIQEECIKLLEEDIEAEKLVRLTAQSETLTVQCALQSARVEFEDMRAAHEATLADTKSIEARLSYVTSEEGRKEIIEGYRHGPIGKVELSLAIKAGYDFLKARLPSSAMSSATVSYPPRVQNCLSILQDLEA